MSAEIGTSPYAMIANVAKPLAAGMTAAERTQRARELERSAPPPNPGKRPPYPTAGMLALMPKAQRDNLEARHRAWRIANEKFQAARRRR